MNDLTTILNWFQSEFPHLEQSFHDGKNDQGKQVTNPTYGFGAFEQSYANGKTETHFQIGVAQTSKGISIYLLGIRGKLDLKLFGERIGKAKVTSYCISFRKINDLNLPVLKEIIQSALALSNPS